VAVGHHDGVVRALLGAAAGKADLEHQGSFRELVIS
jgi:hypothetical protein